MDGRTAGQTDPLIVMELQLKRVPVSASLSAVLSVSVSWSLSAFGSTAVSAASSASLQIANVLSCHHYSFRFHINKFRYPKHDVAAGGSLAKKGNGLTYGRTDGQTHPLRLL